MLDSLSWESMGWLFKFSLTFRQQGIAKLGRALQFFKFIKYLIRFGSPPFPYNFHTVPQFT